MWNPFSKPLEIIRKDGKPFLNFDGIWEEPEETRFIIKASVQPLRSNEMRALPEGRRGCRAVKVYSKERLYMADQKEGLQADRFFWLGREFEVTASDPYQNDQINHWRAYAIEVQDH